MGILWFALIIPILVSTYLLVFHKKSVAWWELLLPSAISVLTIITCQGISVMSAVNDTEYWGHIAVKVVHEEPFSYDDT